MQSFNKFDSFGNTIWDHLMNIRSKEKLSKTDRGFSLLIYNLNSHICPEF